jgi:hypothetical protein
MLSDLRRNRMRSKKWLREAARSPRTTRRRSTRCHSQAVPAVSRLRGEIVGPVFLDNSVGVTRGLSAGFRRALRAAQSLATARLCV